jgi:glycosyltransferase involved in cell wall biosynthesis
MARTRFSKGRRPPVTGQGLFRLTRKVLPTGIRRKWRDYSNRRLLDFYIADLAANRRPKPGPVTIAGLYSTTMGLGTTARLLTESLRQLGEDVFTIDCTDVIVARKQFPWRDRPPPPGCGGRLVLYMNPSEVPAALHLIGRDTLYDKTLIGRWWWETDNIPAKWRPCLAVVDEIWAGSRFTQAAFRKACPDKPVKLVPPSCIRPEPSARTKADFGLTDNQFLVLSVFDLRSGEHRKNPYDMLKAFKAAFGASDKHHYIMRISSADRLPNILRRIAAAAADMPNVSLLTEPLETADYAALVNCADIYLGLHRSEGFGLPVAEAMALGKPAVVTAWSGVMDFVDRDNAGLVGYRLVPVAGRYSRHANGDDKWAQPDVGEAAQWLKRLADDQAPGG